MTFESLTALLRHRAAVDGARHAYSFLTDGEEQEERLTYSELDTKARAIAVLLQQHTQPGDRVLLLYPPGLEYVAGFFGSLYAGCIAVPAYPPDPMRLGRTLPRLQAIAQDCGAKVILTIAPLLAMAEVLLAGAPDLRALGWFSSDDLPLETAKAWREGPANELAFLQYTSGSTASPRGVMLTHANLLHNLSVIQRAAGYDRETRSVTWVPPYHDMGLIGGILEPCFGAFPATLISPVDFLRRPMRWLRAMSRLKATTSAAPNFAFDLCVRKSTEEDRRKLDLSHLTVVFNGAEPIHHETVQRFCRAFAVSGFKPEAIYPCYGLAESTLIASGGERGLPPKTRTVRASSLRENIALAVEPGNDARTFVGCGSELYEGRLAIVHQENFTRCAPGEVGEIWLQGPSVARGYWNRPEATEHTFRAKISDEDGYWLRTGDLGFVHERELFVTGRLKDLIILNGQNFYPQDLERTVEESHPALRAGCSAAFALLAAERERLVVAVEVEKAALEGLPIQEIGRRVTELLGKDHSVPLHELVLLAPGSIPKTSSGKIQRHATKAAYEQAQLETVGVFST